jgi:hypothetical protein
MDPGSSGSDDAERRSPTVAVIEAVAEAEGVRPEEVCPPAYESLYSAIDPNALDALFAPHVDGTPRSTGTISFRFAGYRVVVDHHGTVTLEPGSDHRE